MKWKQSKEKKQCPGAPLRQPMTDPQGSYTGVPEEILEKPVQDADDL